MKITVKKLADLRKPAHNIRRHSDKQITEYIRSIEMFGQIKPLVVDEHGEIIAGNGLFEALTRMGRETCDCYVVTGLTDVQKKKLMMADNKVYELGFTDTDAIEQLVKELDGDTDVPGWDTIRGALMAFPGRVAIDAAAITDAAEEAEYLRKEVNILCAQLAQYRYDPKAYEARVRERMSWGEKDHEDDDE